MLRDKSLIPLSHQHQRALALCVRIDRAHPIPERDLEAWQVEINQHFRQEIDSHFSAEEGVLFPIADHFDELKPLVEELTADHARLREFFLQAESRVPSSESLSRFAQTFSAHIRKEERQLFERLQKLMTGDELKTLGANLEAALKKGEQACLLPNQATRLKPRK